MIILWVHLAATLFMTGLIWFVQVVHYPLMARVGVAGFGVYALAHQRRTGLVVGPAMLIEAATGLWLVWPGVATLPRGAAWAGLGMIAALWLSTALLQVPLHRRLEAGYDAPTVRRLVQTNWLRTTLWSARGGMLIAAVLLSHAP